MANIKVGTVIDWRQSSPVLATFRLLPETGSRFSDYKAGQYIALRRDDCRLTKKVIGEGGKVEYTTILDGLGNPKRGAVSHSYSIASAPFETKQKGYLEFYVILEKDEKGVPGRLTESMFRMVADGDGKLVYFDKIAGEFTLERRAVGFRNVVFVGTGTGLAPFVSMIKQIHHDALNGKKDQVRYTLIHANRTFEELDYYDLLSSIQASGEIDFVYVPSVSRPSERDRNDSKIGQGRANNLLRRIFAMPLREEQDLEEARSRGEDVSWWEATLKKTIRPVLPAHLPAEELRMRMDPPQTVIITCGNPSSMEDIKYVADANQIRFEKEDW